MTPSTKRDPAVTIQAADRLLETTENPLHRQILENYRRHAILDITGDWEAIFDPDMMVEEPAYTFDIAGLDGLVVEGAESLRALYRKMELGANTIVVIEDEQLMVSDWGFASESTFITYLRGRDLLARNVEVDDPDGYYNLRQRFAMIWRYDERGRLSGEHMYEAKAFSEVVSLVADEYLTVQDARARLVPLLRPLPKFVPSPG